MSKAYPSNLTRAQYEFLSDIILEAKLGGRPREVDIWEILNAIFSVLVAGVQWRALPGDYTTTFVTHKRRIVKTNSANGATVLE